MMKSAIINPVHPVLFFQDFHIQKTQEMKQQYSTTERLVYKLKTVYMVWKFPLQTEQYILFLSES